MIKYEKKLIVMVGNIGSGKSTLAKEYVKKGYIVVCRDALRYMIGAGKYIFDRNFEEYIWSAEHDILSSFMTSRANILIDETGMSRYVREPYLFLAESYQYKTTALVLRQLGMKESVNRRMKNPHDQYDRNLWETIYKKFQNSYQEPTKEEGFDEVIFM